VRSPSSSTLLACALSVPSFVPWQGHS
jgi:hypothetical protein